MGRRSRRLRRNQPRNRPAGKAVIVHQQNEPVVQNVVTTIVATIAVAPHRMSHHGILTAALLVTIRASAVEGVAVVSHVCVRACVLMGEIRTSPLFVICICVIVFIVCINY